MDERLIKIEDESLRLEDRCLPYTSRRGEWDETGVAGAGVGAAALTGVGVETVRSIEGLRGIFKSSDSRSEGGKCDRRMEGGESER
jgi:hypothetical protein